MQLGDAEYADAFIAETRKAFDAAAHAIGLDSTWDGFTTLLSDWGSDTNVGAQVRANMAQLAPLIDDWAGRQRAECDALSRSWSNWNDFGNVLLKDCGDYTAIFADSTLSKALSDTGKATVAEVESVAVPVLALAVMALVAVLVLK